MKISTLIIGILIGAIIGFGFTKLSFSSDDSVKEHTESKEWQWEESLDAIQAAPENHTIVYEDENVRVLAVSLDAGKSEPIHTHKWKSLMWISDPIAPCKIFNYKRDAAGKFAVVDSVTIPEMPVNKGQLVDPEGPTSIENLSNDKGLAYRVEFKKDFRP